jgi:predicted NBD/HSP70 family sugar kinase
MRYDTYLTILSAIHNGTSTKRKIHDETKISWASCSDIINDLCNMGIIIEDEDPKHQLYRPGPKTTVYKFNNNKNLILGLEITPDFIVGSLIDLGKNILFKKTYSLQENITDVNIYRLVRNIFYRVIEDSAKPEESITTLVFALTGAIDRDRLLWITSPKIYSINSVDFHFFQNSLPHIKRVFIEHDIIARANSIIEIEKSHPKNFSFLHISDGVGMTVMNNGKYIQGYRGLAGELGHISILDYQKIHGLPCYCGQKNCLESFLSSKALLNHIKVTYGEQLESLYDLHERLSKPHVDAVFALVNELLLNITTTTVNLFDSQIIYLGGCVVETWYDYFQESFLELVRSVSWQGGPESIQLYHEEATNPSYGAAISVIHTIVKQILLEVLSP